MASGIKNILAQLLMSKIGGQGNITDYQQKNIDLTEQETERRNALAQIDGIDKQAQFIAATGGDVDAYYSQHVSLYEQFAPYRVQDGKVLSNVDAAGVVSTKLARAVTDLGNEATKLKAEARVRNLEGQSTDELDTKVQLIDDIASKVKATGAQQLQILATNASREKQVFIAEIGKLQSLSSLLPEQKKRLAHYQTELTKVDAGIEASHKTFGQALPVAETPAVDTSIATPPLTSKTEISKPKTTGTAAPHEQGIAMRHAIGSGLRKAVELPGAAASRTIENIGAVPDALLGLVGAPPLPTPAGINDQLSQLLYKLLYKKKAEAPTGDVRPAPTNINEKLLSGVR